MEETRMPELRRDPISGRWVIMSPERRRRPVEFRVEAVEGGEASPFREGQEHLTPPEVFAVRPGGTAPNGPGWLVRVVPNRYPALRVEGHLDRQAHGIYDAMNGVGAHEVIIETPEAGRMLEEQPLDRIAAVLEAWKARMLDLARDSRLQHILVFKNHGPLAGATIAHPHSQLVATPVIPSVVRHEMEAAREYYAAKERNLFEDVLRQELRERERLAHQNDGFAVFCPFASRSPFELMILPRRQSCDFDSCDAHELLQCADALQAALGRVGRALERPPYNLVLHTAPVHRKRRAAWDTIELDFRWHIEIVPRLTQYAGFELGTGVFINPVPPEEAAKHLRQAG